MITDFFAQLNSEAPLIFILGFLSSIIILHFYDFTRRR